VYKGCALILHTAEYIYRGYMRDKSAMFNFGLRLDFITAADKKLSYCRDSAVITRSLRCSMSFNVTDFGTNRKSLCDFE